jgi:heme/copper-type cytochrome/quinol oxidase subunit 4
MVPAGLYIAARLRAKTRAEESSHMGRLVVWVVIAVLIVVAAFWIAGRASHAPQSRIEAPVTTGNAS